MLKVREGFSGQRSIVLPKMIVDMMKDDAIVSSLHITDIGYYPCAANHYIERNEPIGEYLFIYCTDGHGWYRIGESYYEVQKDTYFILPAGQKHAYGAKEDSPWTIYWIHFSGNLAPHYAAGCNVPHQIKPGINSRIHNRGLLFEEIYRTLDSGYHIEGLRYAMSLFHHYLGTLLYLREYRRAGNHSDEQNIVDATVHFMTENIERSLTLAEISSFSGFSPSYLSAVFKARTGHSPLSYFNLLKIRHACLLLDETDMKINSVCHKVGITDPYYFSRVFSKVMGMSPTAYRHRP